MLAKTGAQLMQPCDYRSNLGVATDAAARALSPSMLALSASAALLLGVALLL